jgi:hypothetical protein
LLSKGENDLYLSNDHGEWLKWLGHGNLKKTGRTQERLPTIFPMSQI